MSDEPEVFAPLKALLWTMRSFGCRQLIGQSDVAYVTAHWADQLESAMEALLAQLRAEEGPWTMNQKS